MPCFQRHTQQAHSPKRQGLLTLLFATSLFFANAAAYAEQGPLSFDIPPGSLSEAINRLAQTAGVAVVMDADKLEGLTTQGLQGAYSIEQGFNILLERSGYRAVRTANGYVVRANGIENTPLQLAPIMVQGELQTRTLQDTQTSVAVMRGDALERRASENLYDIAERVANVSSENLFGLFSIRGIRSAGFGGGGGSLISTRVDGAALNNSRLSGRSLESTWDLEQIEILRGPQSTQAGRNALAGAVEIRSKDPIYEDEAKVRLELGNASTFGGAIAVNVPLVEDTLAFRLSVDREKTDGFVDNPTLGVDDYAREEQTTLRTSVRLDPTDDLSAILKYTRVRSSGQLDGPAVDRASFPDRRVIFAGSRIEENGDLDSLNLRLGYNISDAFRLESETTYYEGDIFAEASPVLLTQENQSFEQEIKMLYRSDRTQAVIGGFYARDEFLSDLITSAPASIFGGSPTETAFLTRGNSNDATNYAVFAEVEHRAISNLRLIVGGRYDRESRDNVDQTVWSSTDPMAALPVSGSTDTDTSFDAWLPKVGVVYDFTDDLSLGFTVQRGYRAGGAGFNLFTGEQFDIDPEYTWNYEASLRSQWLNDRLTINANVFYTDWTDQQVRVQGPSGDDLDFTVENAGESRLFGGEIEAEAQITNNLDVFVSLGYVDTKFKDFISGGEQLAGNEFPFAPKFTGAFGGTYYFFDGFFFSTDASFQDDVFSDVQNTKDDEIDGQFLTNARLGYETEDWSVLAYIDNVFDKDYEINIRGANVIVGDPLTFGVIGQVRF